MKNPEAEPVPHFSTFLHLLHVPVYFNSLKEGETLPRLKQVTPTTAMVTGEATKGHASGGQATIAEEGGTAPTPGTPSKGGAAPKGWDLYLLCCLTSKLPAEISKPVPLVLPSAQSPSQTPYANFP